MTTPIDIPSADNFFTLDRVRSPGIAKIKGGGFREEEWAEQQTPGETGSNNIFRFEKVATITYELEVWLPAHFTTLDALIANLNAGKAKRPPQAYRYLDMRVAHNGIKSVAFGSLGPRMQPQPGVQRWTYELKLVERKPRAPFGGPVKAPQSDIEKAIAQVSNENAQLAKALDSLNAAKAVGK
jgi:hypothetical protein